MKYINISILKTNFWHKNFPPSFCIDQASALLADKPWHWIFGYPKYSTQCNHKVQENDFCSTEGCHNFFSEGLPNEWLWTPEWCFLWYSQLPSPQFTQPRPVHETAKSTNMLLHTQQTVTCIKRYITINTHDWEKKQMYRKFMVTQWTIARPNSGAFMGNSRSN